jgi:hypothetical protein
MMILRISLSSLLSFMLGATLFAAEPAAGLGKRDAMIKTQDNRAADAAAIRAHIESIFQAFIDGDRDIGNTTVTMRRFRIMDVYAKRKGSWIQVASHTVIDPEWRQEQISKPTTVTPEIRAHVLAAREAVWKAWFANDRATLSKLIPDEAIAINSGADTWSNRAAILADAEGFADSGGKLVNLEFPKTEMQIYGNTIIVYTTYRFEIEANGKRTTESGRGTEIFVRRGNELVNTGWHLDAGK